MNFEWIDYYTEFATKLLTFKDNREALNFYHIHY